MVEVMVIRDGDNLGRVGAGRFALEETVRCLSDCSLIMSGEDACDLVLLQDAWD
jgi:hypothetical protein